MRYLCVTMVLLWNGLLYADTASATFQTAAEDYKKGDFAAASQKYEAIAKEGNVSPELYYNLGNAYFKQNQLGKCILNYERAALYGASDVDLQHNLAVAKERVKNEPEQISNFFLQSWWEGIRNLFSLTTWSIISIIGGWSGVGGLCLWLLGSLREHKKRGFWIGVSFIPLSLVAFLAACSHYNILHTRQDAVVLSESVQVRTSPDELGSVTETLGEGVKVLVLDQIGSWYKIRLSNGAEGWLTVNQLEKI
jgi:tetratricopeptide (TPR) repeat protein